MNSDTICALATPPGGAIGILRISGNSAVDIADSIFSKDISGAKGYSLHHGQIAADGEYIDDVMLSVYRAPHSYTGEDCVEMACHGSPYILRRTLAALVQRGCRLAEPGEYTMRAFLNGKMDLSQAEAVADLIAAGNKATHDVAATQMRGGLTTTLQTLRQQLLRLTSLLELELDFADHEELEFADRAQLLQLAVDIERHISRLKESFHVGQVIKNGIPIAIIGKTNVGKSTLLNLLVRDNRAIVSSIHGTTRDTIEDTIEWKDLTLRFIDTAGIRQTDDTIEQIGIQRTLQAIEKALIVVWVMDEWPGEAETDDILKQCQGKHILLVWNKNDLCPPPQLHLRHLPIIAISAKHRQGTEQLEDTIYRTAKSCIAHTQDIIITNARHYDALTRAQQNLQRTIDGIRNDLTTELISEDLRQVLGNLADITGDGLITSQETLNNIFAHFCVGK